MRGADHLFSIRFLIAQLEQHMAKRVDGLVRIRPERLQRGRGAAFELAAEDVHQANGRKPLAVSREPDLGAETIGTAHELGGGSGVEAVFV